MKDRSEWSIVLSPLRDIYVRYWGEAKWLLFGIALVVVLASTTAVAAPYLFSRLVDQLQRPDWIATATLAFAVYAVLLGISTALQSIVQYLAVMSAQRLNFIAGTSFFERVLKKRLSFFIDHNPAEIQNAQTRGETALYVLVQLGIIVLLPGIIQITFGLGVLGAVIDLQVVLIVVGYGAAFIALTYFANHWTRPLLDQAINASQENSRFIGNAVNAMETLRYFAGDRWVANRFADKADQERTAWETFAVRRIIVAAGFGVALAVQFVITFAVLLPRFGRGELSLGDIVLFNTLLLQLNQPFQMIGTAIDELLRSYTRFLPFARMWAAPEEPDAATESPLAIAEGTLRFENVSFAYGEAPTVEDISFAAERGRITFIVGETGSGKSTLFKLALKSLEPSSGQILIDGTPLDAVSRATWFAAIGVVPQEVMLLNDTLESNIVLGRPLDSDRLREAARKASIDAFISGLPEGYQTTVGERGLKLSGGERQRVAIARALYAGPRLLFLDEASSALDEQTEAEIMGELRRLQDETTILAITHRRSVISARDRVVDLAPVAIDARGGDSETPEPVPAAALKLES